jgi:pimeloyl-ACP methyl ester carboxylesterase
MNLVAQSFGAIVAAEYARVYPGRVAKMVFLNATGPDRKEAARFYGSSPAPSDTASARLRSEVLKSLFEGNAADPVAACRQYEALDRRLAVGAGEFVKKGTTCEMPAAAVRYYYRYTAILGPEAFGKWDFTHSLSELQAPLLVIDGERDKRGLAMERAWARAVPNGRLLIIPDAGRVAHAERPEVVFPAIDEFLRGTWPKGALP